MKRLALLIVLFLALPLQADNTAFVIYSLDTDMDGDGTPERLLVLSHQSPDPSKAGPKKFLVMKKNGETYKTVYRDSFDASFYTKLVPFQWEGVDNAMPGISTRRFEGQKYPAIWVVFTPSSSDFLSYTFNGTSYKRDEIPDGI